jgi:hypothetical protein
MINIEEKIPVRNVLRKFKTSHIDLTLVIK